MFKALKDAATQLGLRTSDEPQKSNTESHAPQAQSGEQPQIVTSLQTLSPAGNADMAVVAQLEEALLKASPIIGAFMKNVDIARRQFPNDENARMKAALAFTNVDKATLVGEIERTIAAALLQAKKSADADRQAAHRSAVGSLAKDLEAATSDIRETQGQISTLQQKISAKQALAADLQGKIRTAEAGLAERETVIKASFARVEEYVASLKHTFNQL